jgi:hypothetical protein
MFRYLVLAALFFVLSPGNFLTLPRGGSKRVVALTHAVVFVVAYYLSEKVAEMLSVKVDEGFQRGPDKGAMLDKYRQASQECDSVKLEQTAVCSRGPRSDYCRKLKGEQERICQNAQYVAKDLNALGIRW